jgi:radical SAM superfamily enzyme YgiQ (UPF0313 family)
VPKVLFTTVYNKKNVVTDMVAEHVKTYPRAGAVINVSPGLRFLKQNIQEIEILEYPTWKEFSEKLKEGFDIVGFSVYLYQIEEIKEMITEARKYSCEIWAGNFGAPFKPIEDLVDRVITDNAFNEVAELFGYKVNLKNIEHPVMTATVTAIFKLRFISFGLLYTSFGCPYTCNFCQTPVFVKHRFNVTLKSIERVLKHYYKIGIRYIAIFDETFGSDHVFYNEVTLLLKKYKMIWAAQSRVEIFLKNFDLWYERGLRLPGIGVEFMDDNTLKKVNKSQTTDQIQKWAKVSRKPGVFRYAFSIIGHPHLDVDATVKDAYLLKNMGFEINRTSVFTPFPHTELWTEIENKFGIDETDYSKYDSRNLIWKHPYISKKEMLKLLQKLKTTYNSSFKLYKEGLGRLVYDELKKGKFKFFFNYVITSIFKSYFINDKKQIIFENFKELKIKV